MSRSRKKYPIGPICCIGRSSMKKAKKQANSTIRNGDDEMPSGNHYRRVVDRWSFPDDRKKWFNNYPKVYRK